MALGVAACCWGLLLVLQTSSGLPLQEIHPISVNARDTSSLHRIKRFLDVVGSGLLGWEDQYDPGHGGLWAKREPYWRMYRDLSDSTSEDSFENFYKRQGPPVPEDIANSEDERSEDRLKDLLDKLLSGEKQEAEYVKEER